VALDPCDPPDHVRLPWQAAGGDLRRRRPHAPVGAQHVDGAPHGGLQRRGAGLVVLTSPARCLAPVADLERKFRGARQTFVSFNLIINLNF
jgi:hypothetical protein